MISKYRIMYWKEIPVQVKVEDDLDAISEPLDPRFQQAVDAISMFDGSMGSDDYLMGWAWGEEIQIEGNANDIAQKISEKYNSSMPKNLISKIKNLQETENRSEKPGSIDKWMTINDK